MAIPVIDLGDRFIRFMLFAAILAAGVLLAQYSVRDYAKARASLAWPSVEGVVLDQDRWGVTYAYSWSGRTRQSSKERFLTGFSLSDVLAPAEQEPARFVKVYVSPANPDEAVLHRGGGRVMFALATLFGAGLAFIGGGGVAQSLVATHMRPYKPLSREEAALIKARALSSQEAASEGQAGLDDDNPFDENAAPPTVQAGEALSFTDFAEEHRQQTKNEDLQDQQDLEGAHDFQEEQDFQEEHNLEQEQDLEGELGLEQELGLEDEHNLEEEQAIEQELEPQDGPQIPVDTQAPEDTQIKEDPHTQDGTQLEEGTQFEGAQEDGHDRQDKRDLQDDR